MRKQCPKCKITTLTLQETVAFFGTRIIKGKSYLQSYCKSCRKKELTR